MTVIPIAVYEGLKKRKGEQEIRRRVETIHSSAKLKSAENCCKPKETGEKTMQTIIIIIIIIIIINHGSHKKTRK